VVDLGFPEVGVAFAFVRCRRNNRMQQAAAFALRIDNNCEPEIQRYQITKARPAGNLPAVVSKIIEYFDGKRSLADVCRKGQISVSCGQAIVKKLTGLGILETVATTANETFLSCSEGFAPEEEAFFASEVEPIDECDEPFESVGEKVSLFFSELILRLRGNPVL
jgi:hypothetical protein